MKKLMVMLMGAAAAICAHTASADATFVSGTAFSDWPDNEFAPPQKEEGLWTIQTGDDSKVTTDTWTGKYNTGYGFPGQFEAPVTSTRALQLKTNSKLLERALGAEAKAIGAGLYYDSLVRFTVFDKEDTPTIDSDAKIGVYLQQLSDDDTQVPHLMVVAGYVAGDPATVTTTPYDCGPITDYDAAWEDGSWARLTIKALDKIKNSRAGFVVFVNKSAAVCATAKGDTAFIAGLSAQAAAWNNVNKLFPSIATGTTLAAVGFNGQGATDLISFTDEAPDFARDMTFVAADWSALLASGATVTITVGGETYTPTAAEAAAGKANIVYTGTVPMLKIEWTDGDAICGGEKSFAGNVTITAGDIDAAVAKFAGKNYATLKGAVDAATTDGTLKLLAAATEDITFTADVNVTLDVNGFNTKAIAGAEYTNGSLTLDNSSETVVIVDGKLSKCGSIANTKFKFNYSQNYNQLTKKCTINADLPNGKKLVAEGTVYWVFAELETWTVTVDATLGEHVTGITADPTSYSEDAADKTVTLSATFETGYELNYFTVDGVQITGSTFALEKSVTVNAVAKASKIAVTGVELDITSTNVVEEEVFVLTATVKPDDATVKTVTWTVEVGTDVVTVDNGTVTALKVGTATVRATSEDDTTKYAECVITVAAKQTGPYTPGTGGGSVTPGEKPGEYIVAGDPSTHSVTIEGGLSPTDTIIVQDAETANIIGVPADQIKVVLDSVEVDKTAFIGGDEKGYSLELNPETTTPEISDVEKTADLDIAAGKIACSGIKGLFYSLVKSDEVAAVKTQEKCIVSAQCKETGDAVELQDETEKGAKAFYLIKVGKAPMELLDD